MPPLAPVRVRTATLGRILQLSRPEWRSLSLGVLFLAIGSAMGLLYPQGLRVIIDSVLGGGGRTALVDRAALAMVSIALVQAVAVAGRALLFGIAGERIVARLRESLFRSIVSQEIGFF